MAGAVLRAMNYRLKINSNASRGKSKARDDIANGTITPQPPYKTLILNSRPSTLQRPHSRLNKRKLSFFPSLQGKSNVSLAIIETSKGDHDRRILIFTISLHISPPICHCGNSGITIYAWYINKGLLLLCT